MPLFRKPSSASSRERTPEDRERERERRRAVREGRASEPEVDTARVVSPAPEPLDGPEPESGDDAEDPTASHALGEDAPVFQPPAIDGSPPGFAHAEIAGGPASVRSSGRLSGQASGDRFGETFGGTPGGQFVATPGDRADAPGGEEPGAIAEASDRGAEAGERVHAAGLAAGAASRLPPPPSRRDTLLESRTRRIRRERAAARGGRPRLTRGRVGAILAILLALFVIWFLVSLFQPFHGSGHGRVIVDIPGGSSASRIGSILAKDGVVSSGFFFDLRAALSGQRGDLHSGRFVLQQDMTYSGAIDALAKPPPPVITVKVVVPEGIPRREIAGVASADGLTGNYLAASVRSPLLNPRRYGAPRGTPNLEGFLFPATYDLRAGASVRTLVSQQLVAFRRNLGRPFIRHSHQRGLTPYQLLIVASMIEREAAVARDRPLIAAVIYNRLRLGIPLGIDATIRYALNDYSRPLTESDLTIASPYNTRTHHGLPPTPIGNPGVASIVAAEHPARVSYLYYVAAPDGCGAHVFSTSYAKFQRDVAAYQAALAKNGGRVPTCRHPTG
jgi:peptidoglycan lytic transglycosylase G